MTFLPANTERIVPGTGPKNAKIAIVGEAPGAYEDIARKPFVGPAGSVLEQCLHAAGLIRSEVYLTNVVKIKPRNNDIAPYFSSTKGTFTTLGMESVEALQMELNEHGANLIVTCGATAMAALTGLSKILKFRGYIFESRGLEVPRKVLPTIHPAAALHGQYIYRHIIASDLRKAREQSATRELDRPDRDLIYEFSSVNEALEWLEYFEAQSMVSFDIEVLNYEVACISFSSKPNISCSIPFAGQWTEFEELQIWRGVQRVLGNPASIKVGQNLIFDIHFLLTRCGIVVKGPLRDTMLAHSIMFSELQKGLSFLGSIYCGSQAYWKDLVNFDNIKGEA